MFKIDHPLDPAHKYLYDSFVESPDMMNIYKRRGYPPCKRRSGDSNAGMVWRSEPRLRLPVYLPWRICCGLCRRGTCQQSIQDWRRSRRPEGIRRVEETRCTVDFPWLYPPFPASCPFRSIMAHRGLPPHRPHRADFPQRVRQADSPPRRRDHLLVRCR